MAEVLRHAPCKAFDRLYYQVLMGTGLCLVSYVLVPTAAQAQPTAIAHWSFDTNSLTKDGSGNITAAADVTGAHHASVSPTGIGTAAPSAPFVATDSVAGQFGQALRFNGNNYMLFPNLTELMQSNGAPSYSVSLWIKWLNTAAPIGNTVFRTMSTWGNAGAGTPNENSRFSYGFGPNGASTIRAQARHESASANGTDIFARTTTVPTPVNNGSWHMLTWTFDTTLGALNVYYDASLVETFNSTAASFQLADNTSPFGSFGLKGDDATFQTADAQLDEVWVFNSVLTAEQVMTLSTTNSFGPPPVLGDVNGNGVGGEFPADFDPIRNNFQKMVANRTDGDLVRNGIVDFADFRQWKAAFLGAGGSLDGIDFGFASSVPEPSATLLMLLAGTGLVCYQARSREHGAPSRK